MRPSEILCWATVAIIPVLIIIGIIAVVLAAKVKDQNDYCLIAIGATTIVALLLAFIAIILAVTGN